MVPVLAKLLMAALLALLAAGCAAAPRAPATDDLGRPITLKETPRRIISMAPSNTEILFALGLGDRVVGVDDFSDYPPQATEIAKVGGFMPSLEKIIALEPDLVLGIGETLPAYASALEARGIPVVILQPRDMEDILAKIELVGALTGARKQARDLAAQMRREVNAVVAKAQGAPRVRVFYEIDGSDPVRPWTAGPGSFIQALIEMAGGANIAAQAAGPWVQLSAEEIVRADPQVILLGDAAWGVTAESVKGRPGWGDLSAAKAGAIYPIDADITTRPGPRIVQGLKDIARLVHPELFGEGK